MSSFLLSPPSFSLNTELALEIKGQEMSARQCERLAAESAQEREARLQEMIVRQCERLAAESAQERLHDLSARQGGRLARVNRRQRQGYVI